MEYFKINSLWKRDQFVKGLPKGSHGNLIEGEYSDIEFSNIKYWLVDEKVDGTNIRILFKQVEGQRSIPCIMGRTSAAQIPCHLLSYLQTVATWENFDKAFNMSKDGSFEVYLFGEGYGPKIQGCGGNYRKDPGLILFDVWVGGWWLERSSVKEIALKLNLPTVPEIGIMTEEEIVTFVKSNPMSRCSIFPQVMEGVVCRPEPLVLYRNGKPIIFKLKCKEFI